MPAFTTSFNAVTGALTVTGTAAAEGITILETGTAMSYDVVNADGTGLQAFNSVKSIAVDMRGAPAGTNDTVLHIGSSGFNSFLGGALSITGSGGLVTAFEASFNVSGSVAISTTSTVEQLTVQTGPVANFAARTDVTLGATTISRPGTGPTTVAFQGTGVNDVSFESLSFTLGSGTNNVTLTNVGVSNGVTGFAAGAVNPITIDGARIGGFISLNATGASSALVVFLANSAIGTFFSVAGGSGNDVVQVNSTAVLGLGLQPQQQTFGIDLKAGANTFSLGTAGAASNNVVHGSLFYFGAGSEFLVIRNYTITSFVTINAKTGNSGISASISDSRIASFLSFAAAGAANDAVTVSRLSIGQNFALDLGGGTNSTSITNNTYLGSYSHVDVGNDGITFSNNTGFGDVRFSANSLSIFNDNFVGNQIAGNASFVSTGNAIDTLRLGPALGTATSAANTVAIGKSLTINLGTIAGDSLFANNLTVKNDVTLTAIDTRLTNALVGGTLTLSAANATVGVTAHIGTRVGVNNTGGVSIAGNLVITTGSVVDSVRLLDVSVVGTTNITTNAGGDFVDIEGFAGNAGPSQFGDTFQLITGDGSDTILVGFDDANPAQFFDEVLFDGGAATDTLTETEPRYNGGPPTKSNLP